MDNKESSWGWLILIFLFFIVFGSNSGGGGLFGGRGNTAVVNDCGGTSNCQVEKNVIINTAQIRYDIEAQGEQTRGFLGTKIDFYAFENLKDQLQQERTKNVVLENRVYADAQFGSLQNQIERLSCETPKRPPVYAQSVIPCGTPYPQNCGGLV